MESAERPKRRRFQFHLATAVAMMVVAGAWVGLNFHWTSTTSCWLQETPAPAGVKTMDSGVSPAVAQTQADVETKKPPGEEHATCVLTQVPFIDLLDEETGYGLPWPFLHKHSEFSATIFGEWRFFFWPLVFDLLFALGLLAATFFLSEWLIRRRARRAMTSAASLP